MTVFLLGDEPFFPDPMFAEPDGLLAVGGDLEMERLVSAYGRGIFPWYSIDTPILWWSPDPRPVIEPERLHVSGSLRRQINKGEFEITLDTDFEGVIGGCAMARRPQGEGTWLVWDMIEAYCRLHEKGLAHSVEAWQEGELVGGLYGVSLGRAFFGESMFYKRPGASKVAFVHLVRLLASWGFDFVDCQQTTPHMLAFGAREISRTDYLGLLDKTLEYETLRGPWRLPEGFRVL